MAEHLARRGHSVTLVVIADKSRFGIKREVLNGVEIIETPDLLWGRLRSGWDLYNTLVRMKLLKSLPSDFDILHIFETRPTTIFPALNYLKRKDTPLVIDWIDWWGGKGGLIEVARPKWYRYTFSRVEVYFEEKFRCLADGTTVISKALAKRARGLGVKDESILVLRGGVEFKYFPAIDKDKARERCGLDKDIKILGFSSFDSYLDFELLVKSFLLVKKKMPGVKMLVTGNVTKGVRELISSYGVEDDFILTGFLPFEELPFYLGCCDILLLPFSETLYNLGRWPNKVGDYMAAGRPVVTNPTGEIKEVFKGDKLGLTCRYTPEGFAENILFLLSNEKTAAGLGRAARRWAEENLDWDKKIVSLEDFYLKILRRYRSKRLNNVA